MLVGKEKHLSDKTLIGIRHLNDIIVPPECNVYRKNRVVGSAVPLAC